MDWGRHLMDKDIDHGGHGGHGGIGHGVEIFVID